MRFLVRLIVPAKAVTAGPCHPLGGHHSWRL